jgi:hypothetical protein
VNWAFGGRRGLVLAAFGGTVRESAQEPAPAGEWPDVPAPGGTHVLDIFSANPRLVAVAEIAFVTLVCVVVGIGCISLNVCRRKIRLAQFDFELKRDMLQRGFSAEDIRTVIEAGRHDVLAPDACRVKHWTPQTPNHSLQQTGAA